jgi:hypothetical protein
MISAFFKFSAAHCAAVTGRYPTRWNVSAAKKGCRQEIGLLLVVTFDHDPVAGLDDRLEQFGGSIPMVALFLEGLITARPARRRHPLGQSLFGFPLRHRSSQVLALEPVRRVARGHRLASRKAVVVPRASIRMRSRVFAIGSRTIVAAAIFAAVGARLRHLSIRPAALRQALASHGGAQ